MYKKICHDYKKLDRIRWTYATEVQLFEILFQYCNKLNLNINETIIPINICNLFLKNKRTTTTAGKRRVNGRLHGQFFNKRNNFVWFF